MDSKTKNGVKVTCSGGTSVGNHNRSSVGIGIFTSEGFVVSTF